MPQAPLASQFSNQGCACGGAIFNSVLSFIISDALSDHKRVDKVLKSIIETDLLRHTYDPTLVRYKALLKQAALQDSLIEDQVVYVPPHLEPTSDHGSTKTFDMVSEFNNYLAIK